MHAVAIRSNQTFFPTRASEEISQSKRIESIALRSLAELAISLAIGFVVSHFIAPVAITYLFTTILVQCIVSFILRCVMQNTPILQAANFSRTAGSYAQILTHEGGHALSTYLVYSHPQPEIQIQIGRGGSTSFAVNKLTRFGQWLGPNRSLALVTAAGAVFTLLISGILLGIGLRIKNANPETGSFMITYALNDFVTHAYYAISALWSPIDNLGHDFVRLSTLTGIHPVVAAVTIAAIPIIMLAYHFRK